VPVSDLADELGVQPSLIHLWIKQVLGPTPAGLTLGTTIPDLILHRMNSIVCAQKIGVRSVLSAETAGQLLSADELLRAGELIG
jgi:hypothetical protein